MNNVTQQPLPVRSAKVIPVRPRVLSHIEAARYIGESPTTLTTFTEGGRIPYHYSDPWAASVKARLHRRYFLTDLDRFLDERALASKRVHNAPKTKKPHGENLSSVRAES